MRIVFPSSATLLIFIVSPLVEGPMMANTFSSSINCLANENAFSGLAPESLMISWMGLPITPPFAFVSATSISRVLASGAPRNDAGPVTDKIAPILIGSAAWANAPDRTTASRTANTAHFLPFIALSFRSSGSSLRHSSCNGKSRNTQYVTTMHFTRQQGIDTPFYNKSAALSANGTTIIIIRVPREYHVIFPLPCDIPLPAGHRSITDG